MPRTRPTPAVKPFLIRLPPELHEGLRVAAFQERRTFADLIREAVESLLVKGGYVPGKVPAKKGAKKA